MQGEKEAMRHPFGPFSGRAGTAGRGPAEREEEGTRSPGRGGPGTISLLFACAVVLYILFHPHPSLTPSRALEIAKESRDLSPLLSNEEFINAYEDAANALETVGWLVDRKREGGFLVSFIYLDGKGDFKGWFFEVPPGSDVARRVTRSMGEHYAALIDDPTAVAVVAVEADGVVVGFAVGSTNPSGFYRRLLARRWLTFALASVPGLVRNPRAASRIVRAIRYPGSQPQGDDLGGLYSIGVQSGMQGRGIGRKLVGAFLEEARTRGCASVYLHADAEGNDGWNVLLCKMGWRLENSFSTPEGRRMHEYWFVFEGE